MTRAEREKIAQLEQRVTDLETTVKELAQGLDQFQGLSKKIADLEREVQELKAGTVLGVDPEKTAKKLLPWNDTEAAAAMRRGTKAVEHYLATHGPRE
jgi:TolA-binding protein